MGTVGRSRDVYDAFSGYRARRQILSNDVLSDGIFDNRIGAVRIYNDLFCRGLVLTEAAIAPKTVVRMPAMAEKTKLFP